ncbi:mitochondrial inner membrane protein OXA1L-like [Ctenocephalides felis]|uniref:mitochondrial inner membrane protein OXA1L-like n=1 Tax=Ctenocephalides felis TaxID=7515 RepID=UPI000E6E3A0E|nr:mitochondrial inner membrane protein OXA1L-like [Ctenocephalides felis]
MSRYLEVLKNGTTCCLVHVKVTHFTPKICRHLHSASIKSNYQQRHHNGGSKLFQNSILIPSIAGVRYASTDKIDVTTSLLDKIPEPPPIPTAEFVEKAVTLTEPTFASIGLGGWTPVGLVQNCMEFLHIGLDMPWYAAIALGTVVVRSLLFPLVILAQRNAAKMNNYMPELQALQLKMTEARQTGNALDAARYSQEMMMFMRDKQLNPLKNMLVPLAQAPLFISFFMGLRGMANAPVESLKDGGLFWFSNLTVSDPFYLLPIITSTTMWLTIEVGADSARLNAQNMQIMKYVLRALPVFILPFTVNFPGAILWYWTCSNFISLAQVAFLKIPKVRAYFKIDALVHHPATSLPMKDKGFVKGIKESWTNMKITRELEERARADEMRFRRAGRAVVQKTYKYDPTKPRPAQKPLASSTTSYSTKQ